MSIYKGTTLLAGSSISIPLLTSVWQDHKINDISWLCADTFSWQSGLVYTAAYNHLLQEYNSCADASDCGVFYIGEDSIHIGNWKVGSAKTCIRNSSYDYTENNTTYYAWAYGDTVIAGLLLDGIYTLSETPQEGDSIFYSVNGVMFDTNKKIKTTLLENNVEYFLASDGHKIALANQENNVLNNYLAVGIAWFYILDITNTRFKLPRSTVGHGQLIKSEKDGDSWYRLYADGWCEQSIFTNRGASDTVHLLLQMKTADYIINPTSYAQRYSWITSQSTTSFTYNAADDSSQNNDGTYRWYICGFAEKAPAESTQYKYLYFYVGQFTQTAIQQTAGINAEVLNTKMDINASNANPRLATYDELLALQTEITNLRQEISNMSEKIDYTNGTTTTMYPAFNATETHTFNSDGYVYISSLSNGDKGARYFINEQEVYFPTIVVSSTSSNPPFVGNMISVSKGDVFKLTQPSSSFASSSQARSQVVFIFFPLKQIED